MNAARMLDDLSNQAINIVTEAHRTGIEEGLRRMTDPRGRVVNLNDLYSEIAKLDNEFGYQCPCSRFVDDNCERCGKPNPFASKKVGRKG